MSCGCVYVENDADLMSFYSARTHRARKAHFCVECHGVIQPGELYEYIAARWDGDFTVTKTCGICLDVRAAFFCGNVTHGSMWNDLGYHIETFDGEIAPDCLAELPKVARDKVCDLIERYWEVTA